ncbi:membrane attack complex component perforin [Fusarium heterosporum]|uniref:Membrane attack complex component perforin n=1 Tax=Fusarium heterosporum TaxID=42747 RepID=A0A8H5WVB0_FUSHE|nr:membrane attack complex component perforin [Fusarium heterosporum]
MTADSNTAASTSAAPSTAKEEAITTTIHFTDGIKQREAFYLKLLKSSLDDETLSDLRSNIAGLTGSIEISHFPFCGKKGAVVPDSFTVQEYLTECLGIKTEEAKTLEIYMKDASTSEIVDANVNAGNLLGIDKVAYLKNQVGDVAFKWITGTQAKYVPELEQRDWAAISESNALCYGIRVIRVKGTGASPAASTSSTSEGSSTTDADPRAFRLKKRTIWSDNIPTSTIDGVKLELRIPDFIIDDKSYVSIYETETEMQSSMATSSFSETDVAAAGSGSYMGFSGSASMSFAMASSQAAASSKAKKSKKVTIAYNFPRVTVFLDSRSLELTTECSDALYRIKTKEDLYAFQDVYGEFFSTRVQLGGRLFATEDVTGSSAASSSEKANSMKLAAAASFSGWGATASVSASHAQGGESASRRSSSETASTLTWQANGGDTLLCNQPLEWAPTVSYHWNWRATKQDHITSILDVTSKFKGMEWLVGKSPAWGLTINPDLDDAVAQTPAIPIVKRKAFTLNSATHKDGRYLLTYPSIASNLGDVAQACNSAGKNSLTIDSDLKSWGAAFLGPTKALSHESFRWFEAENMNGEIQNEIKYNTKYRLINKERGLYFDYHWAQYHRIVGANPIRSTTMAIVFTDPNGSIETTAIPNKATVHMVFYEYDNNDRIGYVYTRAEVNDREYLFCSKTDTASGQEKKMMITFQ